MLVEAMLVLFGLSQFAIFLILRFILGLFEFHERVELLNLLVSLLLHLLLLRSFVNHNVRVVLDFQLLL
jgi:hypothetical protein